MGLNWVNGDPVWEMLFRRLVTVSGIVSNPPTSCLHTHSYTHALLERYWGERLQASKPDWPVHTHTQHIHSNTYTFIPFVCSAGLRIRTQETFASKHIDNITFCQLPQSSSWWLEKHVNCLFVVWIVVHRCCQADSR